MERSQVADLNKDDLLLKYSSNLSASEHKNHYLSYAKNFLSHIDALDRENINKYLGQLRKEGRSAGTVNFAFRVIHRLFVVNNIDWPFRRGEAPQIGQRDENKPALEPEVVKAMIDTAKNDKLEADETCFLALSTTYGLRREEMVSLTSADISLADKVIFISTIKHGRQRYHLIPSEIEPYLQQHDFSRQYSLTGMSQIFWQIVNRSGLGVLKGHRLGWHSIRRTLLTLLHGSGLDPFAVHSFMRWKGGTQGDLAIDIRYHATSYVGLEGERAVSQEAESDKGIFEKHPFIPFWAS